MRLIMLFVVVILAGVGMIVYQTIQPNDASMHGVQNTTDNEGAPIVEVIVPEKLSANAELGKNGFDAKCASCHGENAAGRDGFGPPLVHKIYEPSHHSDEGIMMAPLMGVRSHHWRFGNMPPVEGVTREDMVYIKDYIRELQRANGIE